MRETLAEQIDRLAHWIIANVAGEPSRSEGAVDTAIRLLGAAQVSGWIAVTPETMPKANAPVLVFCDGLFRVARWTGDRWQTLPGIYGIAPTHWQPLPSPPAQP